MYSYVYKTLFYITLYTPITDCATFYSNSKFRKTSTKKLKHTQKKRCTVPPDDQKKKQPSLILIRF